MGFYRWQRGRENRRGYKQGEDESERGSWSTDGEWDSTGGREEGRTGEGTNREKMKVKEVAGALTVSVIEQVKRLKHELYSYPFVALPTEISVARFLQRDIHV